MVRDSKNVGLQFSLVSFEPADFGRMDCLQMLFDNLVRFHDLRTCDVYSSTSIFIHKFRHYCYQFLIRWWSYCYVRPFVSWALFISDKLVKYVTHPCCKRLPNCVYRDTESGRANQSMRLHIGRLRLGTFIEPSPSILLSSLCPTLSRV